MRTLSKYRRFLEDKDLYKKNQVFWKETFKQISEHSFDDWVITTFANGEDFFDGNPIASAWYPDLNKAVRIVQISSDPKAPLVKVWMDDAEYKDKMVKELVLIVQPSDDAYDPVVEILAFFLTNQEEKVVQDYLRTWNKIYKMVVSLNQTASTLSRVNPHPYNTNNKAYYAIKAIQKESISKKSSKKLSHP